jgi:predicted N-acetyltransferase YhbS
MMSADANAKPSIHVRVATPGDMPAMISVVNSAFESEIFIDGTRTDTDRMSEMMQKGEFLLAEEDSGRVVACVYKEMCDERAYFGMLAVEPSRQGAGLGRLMVEAAENHCRRAVAHGWTSASSACDPNSSPFIASWAMWKPAPKNFIPPAR